MSRERERKREGGRKGGRRKIDEHAEVAGFSPSDDFRYALIGLK